MHELCKTKAAHHLKRKGAKPLQSPGPGTTGSVFTLLVYTKEGPEKHKLSPGPPGESRGTHREQTMYFEHAASPLCAFVFNHEKLGGDESPRSRL